MTDHTPYTPNSSHVAEAWWEMRKREEPDHVSEPPEVYRAEFDRFLARVRRDAAREALDGLAEHANRTANERRTHRAVDRWDDIWRETRKYRDTHYPEETT